MCAPSSTGFSITGSAEKICTNTPLPVGIACTFSVQQMVYVDLPVDFSLLDSRQRFGLNFYIKKNLCWAQKSEQSPHKHLVI